MESLDKRIDRIKYVIPLIEAKKEAVIKGWMEDEAVLEILKTAYPQ